MEDWRSLTTAAPGQMDQLAKSMLGPTANANDLYAALGEELENGAWAVRLYYKPFVRWIWAGGLMMALGGLLCLFDPRYRKRVSPQKTAPEAV